MRDIRLYYLESESFGNIAINNAGNLDDAIDDVMNYHAKSGKRKIIERIYTLKEENEHIINTDW